LKSCFHVDVWTRVLCVCVSPHGKRSCTCRSLVQGSRSATIFYARDAATRKTGESGPWWFVAPYSHQHYNNQFDIVERSRLAQHLYLLTYRAFRPKNVFEIYSKSLLCFWTLHCNRSRVFWNVRPCKLVNSYSVLAGSPFNSRVNHFKQNLLLLDCLTLTLSEIFFSNVVTIYQSSKFNTHEWSNLAFHVTASNANLDGEYIYLLKTCSEQRVHTQLHIDHTRNRNLLDIILYTTFDGIQFLF
jgi:hypothetical protein